MTPKERVLSFQDADVCAKFRRNPFKIASVRARTHRQTDTHRDHTSDLIICPMLCYSNGTDNDLKSYPTLCEPMSVCQSNLLNIDYEHEDCVMKLGGLLL